MNKARCIVLLFLLLFSASQLYSQDDKTIPWNDASVKDFDSSEELAGRSVYEDWDVDAEMKNKPFLLFFYWPPEDKNSDDPDIKSQAEKSEKIGKILQSDYVIEQAIKFVCLKVDMRLLRQWGSRGDAVAMKYGVIKAPVLVFYDRTGFPQGKIKYETTEAVLREKLEFIATIGTDEQHDSKWSKADAMAFDSEDILNKRSIFEDWKQARELGEARPMLFLFYWPEKDLEDKNADRDIKKQAKDSGELIEILEDDELSEQLERYYLFKVDLKELLGFDEEGEMVADKYKVKDAPVIILFDYKGEQILRIKGRISCSSLQRKLKYAADKSDKLLKK